MKASAIPVLLSGRFDRDADFTADSNEAVDEGAEAGNHRAREAVQRERQTGTIAGLGRLA